MRLTIAFLIVLPTLLLATGCLEMRQDSTYWKEVSVPIDRLQLQSSTNLRQPVAISAEITLGSSTCAKMGQVDTETDDAMKRVLVKATMMVYSRPGQGCTADVVKAARTFTFTPLATGTYRIEAVGSRASIDIEVTDG